jgi:DNA-binding CsgD family transcriptional regulator
MKIKSEETNCGMHAALMSELSTLRAEAVFFKNLPGAFFTFEIDKEGKLKKLRHKNFNNQLPCMLDYSQQEIDLMGKDYLCNMIHKDDREFADDMISFLTTEGRNEIYTSMIRLLPKRGEAIRMYLQCTVSESHDTGSPKLISGIGLIINIKNHIRRQMFIYLSEDINPEAAKLIHTLTPREKDVLLLVAKGYQAGEIATILYISIDTVNSHKKNILSKLRLKNNAGLIGFSFEPGVFFWLKALQ